jgi:hypothetical protein
MLSDSKFRRCGPFIPYMQSSICGKNFYFVSNTSLSTQLTIVEVPISTMILQTVYDQIKVMHMNVFAYVYNKKEYVKWFICTPIHMKYMF